MIDNNVVIDMLRRINILLLKDAQFEAREYIQLEIQNLNGITYKECKNKHLGIDYCNNCSNLNCKIHNEKNI